MNIASECDVGDDTATAALGSRTVSSSVLRCSTATAKLRDCPRTSVNVATPTTSPAPLITGDPLDPGEIGAVI
jgi:hypothetical protein